VLTSTTVTKEVVVLLLVPLLVPSPVSVVRLVPRVVVRLVANVVLVLYAVVVL
jgi:hypothetical protein